jgi:hypothetical protein
MLPHHVGSTLKRFIYRFRLVISLSLSRSCVSWFFHMRNTQHSTFSPISLAFTATDSARSGRAALGLFLTIAEEFQHFTQRLMEA